ncbi:hypothetical protein B0H16DRAFT_1446399 [Mycena metata]|uniref:Peptidase S53 activation domain-containing protein n=1 Tax=Mycena metata TaxID=1033252 RepID=A0AAD7P1V9_9AGAR|nr:hypothetical protein B0H16DRAFT_1446399 [Mycena metata]
MALVAGNRHQHVKPKRLEISNAFSGVLRPGKERNHGSLGAVTDPVKKYSEGTLGKLSVLYNLRSIMQRASREEPLSYKARGANAPTLKLKNVAQLGAISSAARGSRFVLPAKDCELKVKESVVPPATWTKFGAAPSDHITKLRIALPQSNFRALEEHLYEISNPHHERYGAHQSLLTSSAPSSPVVNQPALPRRIERTKKS